MRIFQVFGNFGVSIDGKLMENDKIFFEDSEFWQKDLKNVTNPYFENTQEFFEWENLKEKILDINLVSALLDNAEKGSEIIVLEL